MIATEIVTSTLLDFNVESFMKTHSSFRCCYAPVVALGSGPSFARPTSLLISVNHRRGAVNPWRDVLLILANVCFWLLIIVHHCSVSLIVMPCDLWLIKERQTNRHHSMGFVHICTTAAPVSGSAVQHSWPAGAVATDNEGANQCE